MVNSSQALEAGMCLQRPCDFVLLQAAVTAAYKPQENIADRYSVISSLADANTHSALFLCTSL